MLNETTLEWSDNEELVQKLKERTDKLRVASEAFADEIMQVTSGFGAKTPEESKMIRDTISHIFARGAAWQAKEIALEIFRATAAKERASLIPGIELN